jgi:hypothetical protein
MRASKLPRSAKPAEPQLGTSGKNSVIQSPMPTAAAMESIARTKSTTRSCRKSKNWKAEAQERRLRALKDVPAVEMDSWLQYTKWNKVLG